MGPKFIRTKTFVRDHKVELAFGAGVAVTLIIVLKFKPVQPEIITRLWIKDIDFQKMIGNIDQKMIFEIGPKEKIWVINDAARELL